MQRYDDIQEVKEVVGFKEVNNYLQKGWILLATHVAGTAEAGIPNPTLVYVLGWRSKKDQPKE